MASRLLNLAVMAAAAGLALAGNPLPPSNLLVEYMENPIVLDIPDPRFYWLPNHPDRGITQTAYRIIVNNTLTNTQVWDSTLVSSNSSTHIVYGGTPLVSDTKYSWAVMWVDSNGVSSDWSPTNYFGTGLLTQNEWSTAAWIGCPLHTSDSVPNYNQIRAEFSISASAGVTVTQARMYITAVGYYSVRVNGNYAPQWPNYNRPILDPGWTTYEIRSFYNAYDLTNVLSPSGPNAIAVMLGNGWPDISPVPGNSTYNTQSTYNQSSDSWTFPDAEELVRARLEGPPPHDADGLQDNVGGNRQTRIIVIVHTSDGKTTTWTSTASAFQRGQNTVTPTVGATGTWMCGSGALLYDNIYNGCTYDARLETTGWDSPNYNYANGNWTNAVLFADPGGDHPATMTAQTFPAVTIQEEIIAQSVQSPAPGVYVFDLGQNFAGMIRLKLPAPVSAGITITIRHAELLMHPPYGPKDGNIYVANLRSAKATDVYTTKGTSDGSDYEIFEPMFTYHGFRYVEITGLPFVPTLDLVTGLFFRSSVAHAGNIVFPYDTANVLNQLQHAVTWGIGSNLMSVISDCPQRDERKGWMGDSGLSLKPFHYNYQLGAFYTFWLMNMQDNQVYKGDNHPAGTVSDTVPHTFGSYPGDPSWMTAYPGGVYELWRVYGDVRILQQHYANLQLYISFFQDQVSKSGIDNIYQYYGDWCPPPPAPMPPKGFTSAIAVLVDLQRMIEIATALGQNSDAATYQTYRNNLINQFNTAYLSSNSGVYAGGSGLQTANAAAYGINAVAVANGTNVTQTIAAALVNDVVTTHNSHFSTGIIGMRYLHTALTHIGAGNVAVDTLLQLDYPSFGYEFNDPDEPATTLRELLDGNSEGPGMNSRNHHMFSSVGGYLYADLGGIDQVRQFTPLYNPADWKAVGYRHAVLFPRVTQHPNISYVQTEYSSINGQYGVTWINPNGTSGGNNCIVQAAENTVATLSCPPGGGVFTSVVFASFGTPTGDCGSFKVSTCNALNSTSIVANACLNKSTCQINVSDQEFGDPCFDVVKSFSALLTCQNPAGISLTATVPTNARATVRLPLNGLNPSNVTVSESGSIVWKQGAYQPGVTGVYSAAMGVYDLPVGQSTVDVEVGSGTYNFVVG